MEQINKLLIILVSLAIGAIMYIVTIDNKTAENFAKTSEGIAKTSEGIAKSSENIISDVVKAAEKVAQTTENKNIVIPPHPYNECIKLLIDQVNKESKTSDFDKMKAVCFGLLEKEKN